MKRVIRIMGLAMVVAALLVVSIGGAALGAEGNQKGGEAPYWVGEPNGDCSYPCTGEGECNCECDDDGEPSRMGPFGNMKVNNYGKPGPHKP